MSQNKVVWTEIDEFSQISRALISLYNDLFSHIDPEWIVAYGSNKEKPEKNNKPYEMSGSCEPESLTNTKKFFVKFSLSDWNSKTNEQRIALVASALVRIPTQNPEDGKVLPLDYKDQNIMVHTFGPNWQDRELPDILKKKITFKSD